MPKAQSQAISPAVGLLVICLLLSCGNENSSPHTPPPSAISGTSKISPKTKLQIPRGGLDLAAADREAHRLSELSLRYLAKQQNEDGSFGGAESRHIHIGLTAIATMAFLAHGDSEFRGEFHQTATLGVKFLMKCVTAEGVRKGYFESNADTKSRMHGQGLATLALTQVDGMFGVKRQYASSAAELRRVIKNATDVIIRSQSLEGGWDYEPFNRIDDEGSITVCIIQALRGARNAGYTVPPETIRSALDYIRKSQKPDGSVRYSLNGDLKSTFELTAAGAATLSYGGQYFEKSLRRARDFLWNQGLEGFLAAEHSFPFYGLFYAVQVLHLDYEDVRGRRLERCYPMIVNWFSKRFDDRSNTFEETSRQSHAEVDYGPVYRAAFAALTLQIRNGYLPIFQR
ncbi:MAG: prenyltransferase/squalene oxidase repeat-containing protein [Planctomycetota bacterium]